MDSSNLGLVFSPACLQCLERRFRYRELYTRSSFDRWVDFRLNSEMWQLGLWSRLPFKSFIALVTPGGTVSADVRAISSVFLCYRNACQQHHRWSWNRRSCSPIGAAVRHRYSSFYGTANYELGMATHWVGVEEGNPSKNPTQLTGFTLTLYFLFSFLPTMIITKYGETLVDLMKQYLFLRMVTGWKPLQSVLFSHVSVLPSCWNKLQKQLTSFHSLLDLPWRNLFDWTSGI